MTEAGMTPDPVPTVLLPIADPLTLALAVDLVRSGQVIAFPTDTVYGVACDPWSEEAIARLYWAKWRPATLAIPVLVSAVSDVSRVASGLPDGFGALAERFWPGPLTLIVPRHPHVPAILGADRDTIAVRLPDHGWVRALISAVGGALATTSANISGHPPLTDAHQVQEALGGRVSLIVDGGECAGGLASTIVDLVARPPRVLRTGGLTYEALRQVLPDLLPATGPDGKSTP
jgi:L-threonylcarbamoyladenylate synthase